MGIVPAGDDATEVEDSSLAEIDYDEKKRFLPIKRRVNALKNVLHDYVKIETQFYQEIFEIERKFLARYDVFMDKVFIFQVAPKIFQRSAIISGEIEPTDEESTWNYCQEDELAEDLTKQHIELQEDFKPEDTSSCKGIPKFWLKAMLHASPTAELIKEKDHPILEHLTDIRINLNTGDSEMGFTINFYFSPNEYFNEEVLSKFYYFDNKPPSENPLLYDGPQIVRVRASPITWKPGKNVTVKFMRKVKKHKNRKEVRTITKTVKQDSFFNYFDPPYESLTDEDLDEDTAELLQEDFRIANFMRDVLVPRAVLFFTGEAVESDDECDDEDEDDDDVDDSDDGDDNDSDEEFHRQKSYRNKKGGHGDLEKASDEKPECQQS
uniref:Nucleosome assembly protein n=2 Tax=Echinococcus granulosus TaxID=6210 RepID=A0A068WC36_ECHGR|nr:nucleosome assembly protein [Echinococcus granulosus]